MALWIVLSADLNQIAAFILSGAVASRRDLWRFPSNGSRSAPAPDPEVCDGCEDRANLQKPGEGGHGETSSEDR